MNEIHAMILSYVVLLLLFATSMSGVFLTTVFAEEGEHTVRIPVGAASPSCANDDTCYVPSTIRINEGHEIEWVNEDSSVHTVTSGTPETGHDGLFDSGMIRTGGEFEYAFNGFDVGTYPYYCIAHPWMIGNVIIAGEPVKSIDDDYVEYDSGESYDERSEYSNSEMEASDKGHAKQTLLENQRMFGKYKLTVDWIRELPTVNEINGIEILVSDTTKKSEHGSSGGCSGEDHGTTESHGDSMKGGHEGGCPHF